MQNIYNSIKLKNDNYSPDYTHYPLYTFIETRFEIISGQELLKIDSDNLKKKYVQLLYFAYIQLLNKPYENEVTLTEHKLYLNAANPLILNCVC